MPRSGTIISKTARNVWVYGAKDHLPRGSGLRVTEDGVILDRHFVLPRDGTPFLFLPGDYVVEVYATIVGADRAALLWRTNLQLETEQAAAISKGAGVYFDWGPDSRRYHAHIDAKGAREVLVREVRRKAISLSQPGRSEGINLPTTSALGPSRLRRLWSTRSGARIRPGQIHHSLMRAQRLRCPPRR